MNCGVLYISYDGMMEPLGQSQVLAYLRKLAQDRIVHLVSFEKPEDWSRGSVRVELAKDIALSGIVWHPLRYHKKPSALATAWDIAQGTALGLWLVARHRLGIVHARSYVASVMALCIKGVTNARYIFDMRGFWADERVDGGLWPKGGRMYRVSKWFEKRFFLSADHVVSLTYAAQAKIERFEYLKGRIPPITVIPTCADLDRFVPLQNANEVQFVLGYVGSAGTWYEFDAVVSTFAVLLRIQPYSKFLIVNHNAQEYIRDRLAAGGIPEGAVELRSATHAEIPQQMSRMHGGIFFYKPSYSRSACSPTKLGEFLGCGIPCLSNSGVGDMADVLRSENVGIALDSFDQTNLEQGIRQLLSLASDPQTRDRCVAAAQKHFSLDEGAQRYRQIYESLT